METIEIIMQIVSWILASVTTLIAILVKIGAIKTDKELETANKIKMSLEQLNIITDKVQEYAVIAEANGGTSEEKRAFVLKSVKAVCDQYGIPYDEDLVEALLEKLIDLTKKINSK